MTSCSNREDIPAPIAPAPEPSSEQAEPSQPEEMDHPQDDDTEEFTEPVQDAEALYQLPEYQAAAAAGANITSNALAEAQINTTDLLAFLVAVENGGDAAFEVYSFSLYDFDYHKLTVSGGTCSSTGWQKDYGSDVPVKEWNIDNVGHVELLSNGVLHLQYGRQMDYGFTELGLSVYSSDLPVEYVQAYHKYMAALEFNALREVRQAPDFAGINWDFYFELAYRQQVGTLNIWESYPDANFPAEVYEGVVQTHFPVATEQLRARQDYRADSNTYYYEGGRGGAYFITTRVLDITQQDGKTMIRYSNDSLTDGATGFFAYEYETIDGVQRIKRGEQEYLLTVEDTVDGFLYISNQLA